MCRLSYQQLRGIVKLLRLVVFSFCAPTEHLGAGKIKRFIDPEKTTRLKVSVAVKLLKVDRDAGLEPWRARWPAHLFGHAHGLLLRRETGRC